MKLKSPRWHFMSVKSMRVVSSLWKYTNTGTHEHSNTLLSSVLNQKHFDLFDHNQTHQSLSFNTFRKWSLDAEIKLLLTISSTLSHLYHYKCIPNYYYANFTGKGNIFFRQLYSQTASTWKWQNLHSQRYISRNTTTPGKQHSILQAAATDVSNNIRTTQITKRTKKQTGFLFDLF